MFPPDSTCVLPFCIVETNDRTHIVCFLLVGCLLLSLSLSLSLFIFNVFPEDLPGFSRTFRACRHSQNCVSTLVRGGFFSCVSFRVYEAYQSYAMVPLSIPSYTPSCVRISLVPRCFPAQCSCTSWESFLLSEGSLKYLPCAFLCDTWGPLLVPCVF